MEKILAEAAFLDGRFEISRRRRKHAHVDLDLVRASYPLESLVHQNSQDFVLRLARHVGDLVEIEGASMCLFKSADAPGAPVLWLGSEQFHLHPLGNDRGGVEHNKRSG